MAGQQVPAGEREEMLQNVQNRASRLKTPLPTEDIVVTAHGALGFGGDEVVSAGAGASAWLEPKAA